MCYLIVFFPNYYFEIIYLFVFSQLHLLFLCLFFFHILLFFWILGQILCDICISMSYVIKKTCVVKFHFDVLLILIFILASKPNVLYQNKDFFIDYFFSPLKRSGSHCNWGGLWIKNRYTNSSYSNKIKFVRQNYFKHTFGLWATVDGFLCLCEN